MNTKNLMYDDQYWYCVDSFAEEPIMLLQGSIGEYEVNGAVFAKELYSLQALGKKKVKILINSCGGSVIDGMSIYNAIMDTSMEVDTYNIGVCLSIAAVIFLAGNNRIMADYAKLMIHNPWNPDGSDDAGLEMMKEAIIKMLSKDSGNDKEIAAMMERETWMDAEEALKLGFATEIKKTTEKTVSTMESKPEVMDKFNFAKLIMNKYVAEAKEIKNDKPTMRKLTKDAEAKALLEAEALKVAAAKNESDEEIETEEEMEEAEDCKNDGEDIMDSNTEEIVDADGEDMMDKDEIIKNLKAELEVIKCELDVIKNAKAKVEKDAMDSKIITMLNANVKAGKIKADSLDTWKASAEKDYDFTVKLIEGLPINKTAVKFDVQDRQTPAAPSEKVHAYSAAMKMAELQKRNKDLRNKK